MEKFLKFEEFVSEGEKFNESLINEAVEVDPNADSLKLLAELEKTFKKEFPKSMFQGRFANQFGSEGSLSIRLRLIGDKKEAPNGIVDNDILTGDFFVHGFDKEGNAVKPLELEAIRGVSWLTVPDNKYMAYGRQKVPFRKVKGDDKKIVKGFQKTLQKIKQSLKDNMDKIPDGHAYVKDKI